jgi:uncharacterized protein DUF4331
MRDVKRGRAWAVSLSSAVLILTAGAVPGTALAADHLDSPSVAANGAVDLTDIYAFSAVRGTMSAFIVNVNPGAGVLPNSGTTFGPAVRYNLKIDENGDLRPDVTYTFRFGAPASGRQSFSLFRNGRLVTRGMTGSTTRLGGGGRVTAGLFDDPFFFDLDAFKGQVLANGNGRMFCDAGTVDFFKGLNVSSMVLLVPNSAVGGRGRTIGVWATTEAMRGGKLVQLDQMGRPAINTVFNHTPAEKELFNRTQPSEQVGLGFRHTVHDVLAAFGGDPALAKVLIADVLTFQTGNHAGFLNGRRLRNDVIDAELNLVTGGGIKTDCVSNDSAIRDHFPYLAPAN